MSDDDEYKTKKPPTRKRVSRKKIVNTARSVNKSSKIWSICHDTQKDLWQAICVNTKTKEVQHRGDIVEGRNPSFDSLNDVLTKIYLND